MAEDVTRKRNIDVSLAILADEIGALPERTHDMDGSWRDEWPTYMARFEWLIGLAFERHLAVVEQAEYERLLRQLRDYLPLTEQLGLRVPEKVLQAMRRSQAEAA